MKNGANSSDRNIIANLAREGLSSGEISVQLGIVERCIKSFMPQAEKEVEEAPKPAKRKRRTKPQIAADKEKADAKTQPTEESGQAEQSGAEEEE